jgi:hypothetical protein
MLIKKLQQFKDYWGVCVVIYGRHCATWMSALAPESAVWKSLPSVKKVLVQPEPTSVSLGSIKFSRTVILPLMEAHIAVCPKEFAASVPSIEALRLLSDKSEFAEFAQTQGLAHFCPEVFKTVDRVNFPCVIKRLDLNAGAGITIATTKASLHEQLHQSPWKDQPVLLQAFISGHEYVTHCVCSEGQIKWHCTYGYELSDLTIRTPANMGVSRKVLPPAGALDVIKKFIKALAFNGPCNVDYKVDANGSIFVFEINPRLGGSLMLKENQADLAQALHYIIKSAKIERRNSDLKIAYWSMFNQRIQAIIFRLIDLLFAIFAIIKNCCRFSGATRSSSVLNNSKSLN